MRQKINDCNYSGLKTGVCFLYQKDKLDRWFSMISKTQISKRAKNKRNPEIFETISLAKKNNLLELAKKLSVPSRRYKSINLDDLNKINSNKIIIVGRVLGSGEIDKKLSVAALGFSEKALEKLRKSGCEIKKIIEEIKDNKKLEGVEIVG